MNYNERIDKNYLKALWKDGEILQHTDLNEIETVIKNAINANYTDIQKILDGTYTVGSAAGIDGATLSRYSIEPLSSSDEKIPSSLQVKEYVNAAEQRAKDAIPTKVSAFENDKAYIDKTVNNLENYYLKLETFNKTETQNLIKYVEDLVNYYRKEQIYTKQEIDNIVSSIEKVTLKKVDKLPSVGESNVIYFVPKLHTEVDNVFDEFIYVDGKWENIGDTELDNLELDVFKVGHTATLTITKRNGTQESVEIYDGETPQFSIGETTTLEPGSDATVSQTGSDLAPILNFGIPQGIQGPQGPKGFSPSASVTQEGDVTTISITDEQGTTEGRIDLSAWNSDIIARLQTLTTLDEANIETTLSGLAGDTSE